MWKRYRLKTYSVEDSRPLIFDARYPSWCSGYGEDQKGEYAVMVVYLPEGEDLLKYWDDAFDVDVEDREEITFTDRFPKPSYYVES